MLPPAVAVVAAFSSSWASATWQGNKLCCKCLWRYSCPFGVVHALVAAFTSS
jgi:hypothetical protein